MLGRQQSESGSDEGPDKREHSAEVITDGAPLPRIAGYELKGQIGRGASATVYLAREIKHDRLVALKVLRPALAASLHAERFLREISIISKLAHPNILPLLDSGSVGDVLYYVTPYVPGESLRGRLEREGKLAFADAVRLVREVAEALDYAHRQGLVHRDVKPENILLADGHALLADFGIARAMKMALGQQLTDADVRPGTLHYMSPEQLSATGTVDGRSDQYSLACVLYELLSGAPPFTGETLEEIAAKHAVAEVPSFDSRGMRGSSQVKQAIHRALAKAKEDRFATLADFATALAGEALRFDLSSLWSIKARRNAAITLGVVALAVGGGRTAATPEPLSTWQRLLIGFGATRLQLDTTLLVVAGTDSSQRTVEAVGRLQRALSHWRELSIESMEEVALAAGRDGPTSSHGIERAAITLRAGRFIRVGSSLAGDTVIIRASLYDSRGGERLASATLTLGASLTDVTVTALADSLLLRTGIQRGRSGGVAGTNSLLARQHYFRAHSALANGDFSSADSQFARAVDRDPGYPQALAWLSALRSWGTSGTQSWLELPAQATARRAGLAPGDSIVLDAMLAAARKDWLGACGRWSDLAVLRPDDFASWYGLGSCLRQDEVVVRDNSWQYGWRFRSSYHAAVLAFERAFRIRPAVLLGFGVNTLSRLRQLMLTSSGTLLWGWSAAPDSQAFRGYPVWQGDSLVMVPLSGRMVLEGPSSKSISDAIRNQRLRFRDVALQWRREFPLSPDALESHAIALDMLGDESSLDTLRRARALARDPEDRQRMGVNEVIMRLKFSVPANLAGLDSARLLADSLLRAFPPAIPINPGPFGALAALVGNPAAAAAYARREGGDTNLQPLYRVGPALLAFASLGGPADSIYHLEAALRRALENVDATVRAQAHREWLMRAAALAFPGVRLVSLPDSGPTGLRTGDLIVAAWRQDTLRRDAILRDIATAREQMRIRPADVAADALLQEASALAFSGSPQRAIEWLDPTLRGLSYAASEDLHFETRIGPLVRAMVLRAELAAQLGDSTTAGTWARAVVVLWKNADPFLQPTVRRMQELAR